MQEIQHYFDWNGSKEERTACGIKLARYSCVHWVTDKKKVTCKRCKKSIP